METRISGKVLSFLLLSLVVMQGFTFNAHADETKLNNNFELAYLLNTKGLDNGTYKVNIKLKVHNLGSDIASEVVVKVVELDGAVVLPHSEFNLGRIKPGESLMSENFDILYGELQEPPVIVWEVEYTDANGDFFVKPGVFR